MGNWSFMYFISLFLLGINNILKTKVFYEGLFILFIIILLMIICYQCDYISVICHFISAIRHQRPWVSKFYHLYHYFMWCRTSDKIAWRLLAYCLKNFPNSILILISLFKMMSAVVQYRRTDSIKDDTNTILYTCSIHWC